MSIPEGATPPATPAFSDLKLGPALLAGLADVGYETPSPIQAATIPPLLEGRDVLGQAQTGTGKTAAFALPILARLDTSRTTPQALVLAPTRELAIQVAEAFQSYAAHLPGFRVLPIYGGQSYIPQLGGLKRGAQVVVGTPGRVIDHLERGSLDLSGLTTLVLDEADEMLRMGFIDDVEKVLAKTPPGRQIALFSATMPAPIRRIAQAHLNDPAEIAIKARTTTAANIRQRYWYVSGVHKLDALTRILEAEPFEAMLVFTRTKQATEELAEKLKARGFAAAAINGDIVQAQRERTIAQLKEGRIDILVATDVAARGLDVERISHVLNFDIPYDTEAYVHRIGRTGRAGRSGEAILFVTPREKRMLQAIERATRQPIEEMRLPSVEAVNDRRIAKFKQRIDAALERDDVNVFRSLVQQYEQEHDIPALDIAAALAQLLQGDEPFLLAPPARSPRHAAHEGREARPFERTSERERPRHPAAPHQRTDAPGSTPAAGWKERAPRTEHPRPSAPRHAAPPVSDRQPPADQASRSETRPPRSHHREEHDERARRDAGGDRGEFAKTRPPRHDEVTPRAHATARAPGFETFRIEVGEAHGVKPGNIVGAIANEVGLDSRYIGRVDIREDHSLVDLPEGMPHELFKHLKKVWVSGQQLRITRSDEGTALARPRKPKGPPPARNTADDFKRPRGTPHGKPPHRGKPR
ncbi:DEAD/DEAH box helicase [Dokdonella sp.]|uniref:DEAD/DEAH box helicase n=1 Tax=Dokdonella sp. TaxID=2291710 RepID=UPI0031C006B0|nr:DEAD/DEAH box helicase [Dokdonella sp.]